MLVNKIPITKEKDLRLDFTNLPKLDYIFLFLDANLAASCDTNKISNEDLMEEDAFGKLCENFTDLFDCESFRTLRC